MRAIAAMLIGIGAGMTSTSTVRGLIGSLLLVVGILIYADTPRKP